MKFYLKLIFLNITKKNTSFLCNKYLLRKKIQVKTHSNNV